MNDQSILVYPGRLQAAVPSDAVVLSSRDVLPARLWPRLENADALVVLDTWSFPFEALRPSDWDVPLVVSAPRDIPAEDLIAALGSDLWSRLERQDRVVTDDDTLWRSLRERFHLLESQRIAAPAEPDVTLRAAFSAVSKNGQPTEVSRAAKAIQRVRGAALGKVVAKAVSGQPTSRPLAVADIGVNGASWVQLVKAAAKADYVGVQLSPDADWPSALESERFDVTLACDVMASRSGAQRRELLAELYRITRPGGRLVLLEEVGPGAAGAAWVPTRDIINDVLAATARRVVVDHVEALRYPNENRYHTLLLALSLIGVPEKL